MSVLVLLGLGLLGGLGAIARFVLDGAIAGRMAGDFPYGTLAVNLSGSLVLGVFVGAGMHGDAERLAATGLVGAFTTFSTWAYESHRLAEDGQLRTGVLNLAVSLVLGLAVVSLGREIGGLL